MTINAVRSIGVTLATLMATTALTVTGGSSALAAPTDPMTNSLVTLCTGSDNTSPDSWWFTSLVITGLNTSAEIIELIDATGCRPPRAVGRQGLRPPVPPRSRRAKWTVAPGRGGPRRR